MTLHHISGASCSAAASRLQAAQLEQRSAAQAAELADKLRDCDTLQALLEDEQRDNAALRAQLVQHQAALKTVRAACDACVAGGAAGANDA